MGEVPTGTCFAAALEGTIEETGSSNSRNVRNMLTQVILLMHLCP